MGFVSLPGHAPRWVKRRKKRKDSLLMTEKVGSLPASAVGPTQTFTTLSSSCCLSVWLELEAHVEFTQFTVVTAVSLHWDKAPVEEDIETGKVGVETHKSLSWLLRRLRQEQCLIQELKVSVNNQ